MEAEATPVGGHDAELERLVGNTEGLQPWRRLFHAANGSGVVAVLELGIVGREVMILLLGVALLAALTLDVVRLRVPSVQRVFFRSFSALASPREARGIASSTWYAAGILLALLLFPQRIAEASILVLALGDPAASYVGRRWGRIRIGDGSVRGTAAFFVVTLVVMLFFFPPLHAVLATALATVVERMPWGLDDNITLPLGTGVVLLLLGRLMG
jgi:dolichol kinase